MDKQRVNCYLAGCDKCSKGTYEGTNFLGFKIYSCSAYKRKHTNKNARKCKSFRCKKFKWIKEMCRNCRKGE